MTNGERPLDLKVLLNALSEGAAGPQSLLAVQGELAVEALDRLGQTARRFDAGSGQPPEEWRSLLELLTKMMDGEQPVDPSALLDALSSSAKRWPPDTNGPMSS
jgi:hypothetical protein